MLAVTGRSDSTVSRNIVDIAEMAAQQRRHVLQRQKSMASKRLRDRLQERRGLLSPEERQQRQRNRHGGYGLATTVFATAADAEALSESHRVQAEARRASRDHSERTTERLQLSSQRLLERVAARAKAKQSRCLQSCPEFASLDAVAAGHIVDVMEYRVVKEPGAMLCAEGEEADELFVLVSGACDVAVGGVHVRRLEELSVFGEAALFPDGEGPARRTATVTVARGGGVRLLCLSKAAFDGLVASGAIGPACTAALAEVAARRKRADAQMVAWRKEATAGGAGVGELPPHWQAVLDPNGSGRHYYFHAVTKETTWTRPEASADEAVVAAVLPPPPLKSRRPKKPTGRKEKKEGKKAENERREQILGREGTDTLVSKTKEKTKEEKKKEKKKEKKTKRKKKKKKKKKL